MCSKVGDIIKSSLSEAQWKGLKLRRYDLILREKIYVRCGHQPEKRCILLLVQIQLGPPVIIIRQITDNCPSSAFAFVCITELQSCAASSDVYALSWDIRCRT